MADVAAHVPGLTSKPYLVQASGQGAVERVVADLGFRVVLAALPEASDDPEEALLIEFTARLDFTPVRAETWPAFRDRLWDLLTSDDEHRWRCSLAVWTVCCRLVSIRSSDASTTFCR